MTPDLPDLLSTVRDFLQRLAPALTGADRYDAQVGAFLLDVAVREVETSAAVQARSQARLSGFLAHEGTPAQLTAELCERIRLGDLDERWDETLSLVLEETVDEVRLSRPDHLAPEHRSLR